VKGKKNRDKRGANDVHMRKALGDANY
jgi:hypothetical protein